jgi:hypothetical protein
MPLEMERRHLEQANQHIAEGWERIAAQRARVALMERGGHDTGLARELLRHFEKALEHMPEHRESILREIDRLQQQLLTRSRVPFARPSRATRPGR